MRKVLRIARREYQAAVHTKAFLIGLVVAPILMGGGLIVMEVFKDRVDTQDKRIAVVDHSGVLAQAIVEAAEKRNAESLYDQSGKKVGPAYLIEVVEPDEDDPAAQKLELSKRVRRRDLHAFVVIGPDVVHPTEDPVSSGAAYHAENAVIDDLRYWVGEEINGRVRALRLLEAGVEVTTVGNMLGWVNVDPMGLVSVDAKTGRIEEAQRSSEARALGVPFFMVMIMFIISMMGALPLLHSVMEEKTQRIAEVMLGSVRPFQFMLGKVLGGVGVSLTASVVYMVAGAYAFRQFGIGEEIPLGLIAWFFAFMLLNIVMMGAIFAALGSTCNDAKEAQSVTFPALTPIMVPMFLLVPIATQPLSGFATTLSLIPFFTPAVMMLRISTPATIPAWQPWIGLAGVAALALLMVWAGGRIFRVAILMQGKSPHLPDIIRWAVRG